MAFDNSNIVIDSNVLLAALNNSEPFYSQAVSILEIIVDQDIHMHVPPAFILEVEDILIKNLNLGRISPLVYEKSVNNFDGFIKSGFFNVADTKFVHDNFYRQARSLAHFYKLRFYDATYLALADSLKISLLTFDEKLQSAAIKARLLNDKWKEILC